MQATLADDRKSVRIQVSLAGQVAVDVYTRDGWKFEASQRGIGAPGRNAAIASAMRWIAEHPAEFGQLKAQLLE